VYLTAPDNTMLIWLGKQYLEQRDKQDVESRGGMTLKIIDGTDD
jgi:hypothetical protein